MTTVFVFLNRVALKQSGFDLLNAVKSACIDHPLFHLSLLIFYNIMFLIGDRCGGYCCTDLLHLLAGLQASPSKHTSYSVRMENAVPIVTQAPGTQSLQIQPGLLTQV